MTEPDGVHRLEPSEDVVEDLDDALHLERAAVNDALERHPFDELHHEDRERLRAHVERDEAREVRVARQEDERGGFLAEHLQELVLRHHARGGRVVVRHLQREALRARLGPLFDAHDDEHRRGAAHAERTLDEEAADRSTGGQPRRKLLARRHR